MGLGKNMTDEERFTVSTQQIIEQMGSNMEELYDFLQLLKTNNIKIPELTKIVNPLLKILLAATPGQIENAILSISLINGSRIFSNGSIAKTGANADWINNL